jgi:hypothetical protein
VDIAWIGARCAPASSRSISTGRISTLPQQMWSQALVYLTRAYTRQRPPRSSAAAAEKGQFPMSRSDRISPPGGGAQTVRRPAPRHVRELLRDYLPTLAPARPAGLEEQGCTTTTADAAPR